MAIKTILKWGHHTLQQRSTPIEPAEIGSPFLKELVQDLFDTMRAGHGIGLAAPQIGVNRRVFVMEVPGHQPHVFINPFLFETIGSKQMVYEACLSLPGIREQVERFPEAIVMSWTEPTVEHMNVEAAGRTQLYELEAQCAQHEIEHLEGKLLVDHFKPSKQKRLREEYDAKRSA